MPPQPYREVHTAFSKPDPVAKAQARPGISVVGLDIGGTLTIACLAHLGYRMVGIDLDAERIRDLETGSPGAADPRLEALLWEGASRGQIRATQNLAAAVLETDVTLISACDAALCTDWLRQTAASIGQAMAMKAAFHIIVLRTPVTPGSTMGTIAPAIERTSGKRVGSGFGLCLMPEFGRPATTVTRFFSPERTLIGCSDERTAQTMATIFRQIDDRLVTSSVETAEMVVHAERKWQATRHAFTHEIAQLTCLLGGDGEQVVEILGLSAGARPQFRPARHDPAPFEPAAVRRPLAANTDDWPRA